MYQRLVKESNVLSQTNTEINKACQPRSQSHDQPPDCKSLITIISKSSLHILSHLTDLHTRIIDSFPQPQHKLEIFTALSNKLAIPHTMVKEITELNFYALTKFYQAHAMIEMHPNIKKEPLGDALTLLNDANIIIQNNSLELTITPNTVICDLIEAYGASGIKKSKEQAFTFAEDSLKHQQEMLPKNHPSILKLLLTTAQMKYDFDLNVAHNMASRIDDSTSEAKAFRLKETLKYAKSASDMASRIYDSDSKIEAIILAVEICTFHGNDALANIFCQQILNQ